MTTKSQKSNAGRKYEVAIEIAMVVIMFTASAYGIWAINQMPVFSVV